MTHSERRGEGLEGQNPDPCPHKEDKDDRMGEDMALGLEPRDSDRKTVTSEPGNPAEVGVMESISTRPHRRQESQRRSLTFPTTTTITTGTQV